MSRHFDCLYNEIRTKPGSALARIGTKFKKVFLLESCPKDQILDFINVYMVAAMGYLRYMQ